MSLCNEMSQWSEWKKRDLYPVYGRRERSWLGSNIMSDADSSFFLCESAYQVDCSQPYLQPLSDAVEFVVSVDGFS